MAGKVWNEITCPFTNFNGCTVEVWEWISNPPLYDGCDYLSMSGLKLNNVKVPLEVTEFPVSRFLFRRYPAKRALPAVLTHGR